MPQNRFRVFTKLQQCLGNAPEQNIDHDFFIAQNDRIELMGKGEDITMIYTHVLQQGGYGVTTLYNKKKFQTVALHFL